MSRSLEQVVKRLEEQVAQGKIDNAELAAKLNASQKISRQAEVRVPDSFYLAKPLHLWDGVDGSGLNRYLSGCEMYFAGFQQDIPDNAKISYAVRGLEEPARSRWFAHCVEQDGGAQQVIKSMTWEQYTQWCRIFDKAISFTVGVKLANLRQEEGQLMAAFLGNWQNISLDTPDPPPMRSQIADIIGRLLPAYKQSIGGLGGIPETMDGLWRAAGWLDVCLEGNGAAIILNPVRNEERSRKEAEVTEEIGTREETEVKGKDEAKGESKAKEETKVKEEAVAKEQFETEATTRPSPGVTTNSPPVRGRSAYMFFADKHRDIIRYETPQITFAQVGKILGERWKALSEEQRAPYEAQAAAEKRRYLIEKAAYSGGST